MRKMRKEERGKKEKKRKENPVPPEKGNISLVQVNDCSHQKGDFFENKLFSSPLL